MPKMTTVRRLFLVTGVPWEERRSQRTCSGVPSWTFYEARSKYVLVLSYEHRLSQSAQVQTHCYEALDLDNFVRVGVVALQALSYMLSEK